MSLTRRAALAGAASLAAPLVATRAHADGALRIGAPLPITGGLAPDGAKQQRGYELWAEAVNAAGGLPVGPARLKVELVTADYQSSTPRAVQLAERLISQDGCSVLFGPLGSGATKASSSVAERYGVPLIAPSASSKEVYDQGYKFLFGTFTPNQTLTEPLSDIVRAQAPDVRKIAILARNDLFPLAIAAEMEKSAKARGIEVVVSEKYPIGTMDHASALTRIAAAGPQWVFITGYVNDLILARRQMADLRFTAPVITMLAGPAYREYREALGPLAENVTTASWWHPAVRYTGGVGPFPSTEAFNAAFRAKYGNDADYGEASAACCGTLLGAAVAAAGSSDPRKIRDALAALDVMTFFGPIRFAADGQVNSYDPPVMQIQGGKLLVLHPAAIRQGTFQRVARS
jgi:branched-chain amino acid transport system substrate-binding protein